MAKRPVWVKLSIMAITIRDIARELNLSPMTVSRALAPGEGASVKPRTRKLVEEAARRLGYQPNRSARALASGRTFVVGLWISHLHSSVYSQIAKACQREIGETGLQLVVNEMDWHFYADDLHRQFQWPIDGVLAVDPPPLSEMEKLLGPAPWQDIPRVHLGAGQGVPWQGDTVFVDLGAGTRAAIEHLLRTGRRRIAYLAPPHGDEVGQCHYDAYIYTMKNAGLPLRCIVAPGWDLSAARRAVADSLARDGAPDAIYCHHDEFAIAAFRAVRDRELRVPADVAIIGCEGNDFMDYFDPPLSTVAMPIDAMCALALDLLQQRLRAPQSAPQHLTLPFEFLARGSSAQTF